MDPIKPNKKLILFVVAFVLFLIGGIFGSAYCFKLLLIKIPSITTQKLADLGIEFKYKSEGYSRTGSSIDFYDITFTGTPLPYLVEGKSLGVDFKFGFSPIVSINLRINKFVFTKNTTYSAAKTDQNASPPSSLLGWIGPLVKFVSISAEIVDAAIPEYGISDLSASTNLNSVKLSAKGIESIIVSHEMNLSSLTSIPWFPGLCWSGTTSFTDNKLELKNHNLGLGLFATKLSASYDLPSQKWSADITIPDGPIKNKEQIASISNAFWLTSASGEIGMKVSLQGIGGNPASIIGEGIARAKNLNLGMNHTYVRGNLKSDFDISFKKTTSMDLTAKILIDLTDALVVNKDEFRKIKDVPLTFQTEIEGKNNSLQIKSAELVFNNLKSTFAGLWTYLPRQTADIKFEVAPVNLMGWQQFFPRYPTIQTRGQLSMTGSYIGPTDDWKIATINLKLNAQRLKFPILKTWSTTKDLEVEGVALLNSDTTLSLTSGALKDLSTISFIDLKDIKLKYSTLFNKAEGMPFDFDLAINTTKNQAEIKRGVMHLGKLEASAKGRVTNFSAPEVNLLLQSAFLDIPEIMNFLPPTFKLKAIEKLKGEVAFKTKVTGQLLSKAGPDYAADIEMKKLSFIYNMEESKKRISLLNISGPLSVTPNSLITKKLFIQTPNSEGSLDLALTNFNLPDITFSFQGSKFALKDFYDQVKPMPIEASAATVASAPNDDFRKNPFLQKIKVQGNATIKSADLGYTLAENLTIKLNYNKLKLSILPLSFNAFGGSITSETEWDGTKESPVTKQSLKVSGVNANQFITSYSEKAKDIILGKLNTDFALTFSGLKTEEIQKSITGSGTFSLQDGSLKTIRFTKEPLLALKKVPLIANQIVKPDWDEHFNDVKGAFKIENSKMQLTNVLFYSPYFDAACSNATLGFDQSLVATMNLIPKESMMSASTADIIRDDSGKPTLPISISGTVQSPSVGIDTNILIPRTKNYLARQADKEKERAVTEVKAKATTEAKKLIKGKLGGLLQ